MYFLILGGVSGAVSKITGTVGKGLAALTLDDEYQQKRRQQMSQRPTNVGQGLLKGGKGLAKVNLYLTLFILFPHIAPSNVLEYCFCPLCCP